MEPLAWLWCSPHHSDAERQGRGSSVTSSISPQHSTGVRRGLLLAVPFYLAGRNGDVKGP